MNPLEQPQPHLDEHSDSASDGPELPSRERYRSSESRSAWVKRAQDAYDFSTSYVDSNYRKMWENSIRAFNSQHPLDSKYASPSYDKRSHLYRPKTRTVMRKNEAAAAAAFFSNMDVIQCEPANAADPSQRASADVMKQLVHYRLSNSIPWFEFVIGGLQDAQKQGWVVARVCWEYANSEQSEENTEDKMMSGQLKKKPPESPRPRLDRPMCYLLPIEHFRFDPAAHWFDPVNTSPYIIEMMPMYVGDIREMVADEEGVIEWIEPTEAQLDNASGSMDDSTKLARERGRDDPNNVEGKAVSDYSVVWVHRHIHRRRGRDWLFYTLGKDVLLSEPIPLDQVDFTGERDYVIGCANLETHTSNPQSIPEMTAGLQEMANEIANQRIDNVKFVLNKKWFVKRGKNVDLSSLVRNVPGAITLMDDVETDVKEVTWQDVTASAYQEQDRVNADYDELVGNFNPAAMMLAAGNPRTPAHSMLQASQGANMMTEYLLLTYQYTFIQKVLRKLVKLIQENETDLTILTLAGQKAQLYQRFGIAGVTDELLRQDLTIKVNVGMGATDPVMRSQKLTSAVGTYVGLTQHPPPGLNITEIGKEIFGLAGYQDGARFLDADDPGKKAMTQQMQQLAQALQAAEKKLTDKAESNEVRIKSTRIQADTAKEIADKDNHTKLMLEQLKQRNDDASTRQKMKHDEMKFILDMVRAERKEAAEQNKMHREQLMLTHETGLKQAEKSNKTAMDGTQQLVKHLAALTKALGGKRKVVRDAEGRASHLEPMDE
jgi:hypothetical protein